MKKALWYLLYLSFYATLWLTFFNGVNIYMDRFQNAMTALYIVTNTLFFFVTFCMWIINYAIDKGDPKLTASMKDFVKSDKSQDFLSMSTRHEKWTHQLYRYGAFYPAIFCALILLGYTNLGIAMLLDVVAVMMLKAQIQALKEKTSS